jgi:hypothetical protein
MIQNMNREGGGRVVDVDYVEDSMINLFFDAGDLKECLGVVEDAKASIMKRRQSGQY